MTCYRTFAVLILLIAGLSLAGCFSPNIDDGSVSCGPQGNERRCPPGFMCATDGKCYRVATVQTNPALDPNHNNGNNNNNNNTNNNGNPPPPPDNIPPSVYAVTSGGSSASKTSVAGTSKLTVSVGATISGKQSNIGKKSVEWGIITQVKATPEK